MRDPVALTLRGVPGSGALEQYVAGQARELERACACMLACRLVAEALQRDGEPGARLCVRLTITLPGSEVVVNREHGEDIYFAVRDAFEAASLQIKDRPRMAAAVRNQ